LTTRSNALKIVYLFTFVSVSTGTPAYLGLNAAMKRPTRYDLRGGSCDFKPSD